MSKWIWKFGEFERYHSLLVHNARISRDAVEPAVWKQYPCDPVVSFCGEIDSVGGEARIFALGDFSVTVARDEANVWEWETTTYRGRGSMTVTLNKGKTIITVRISNLNTFPCLYIEGAAETDETRLADDLTGNFEPVGSSPYFTSADVSPDIFPFSYENLPSPAGEPVNDGVLFDFGNETYGPINLSNLKDSEVTVCYGESREEALDCEDSVINFTREPENGKLFFTPYAFRYVWVSDARAKITAKYEYLPLERRGEFSCDNDLINKVWEVAAYTFHLNCREFFLDGIKRDRWVWSADAYQCLFVNRYLFFDKDIEQRTLIALAGKAPFRKHVNNIVDYTFFWFISLYDHYATFGDKNFLKQIAPQMEEIMEYCLGREDVDGFIRGKNDDWVFIDWADMDKAGAFCGEQILWAAALERYEKLREVISNPRAGINNKVKKLRERIIEKFYSPSKGAFIDSYESGKENVTRQCNILAHLFLPCGEEIKTKIYNNVILNDAYPKITTPYFKFYENQVHCAEGNRDAIDDCLKNYYGGMLRVGATSFYEEFDAEKSGAEHYAMYGRPYEKSLCHAWSASPVYLLGAYRLGVKNTGIAYDTFEVRPELGEFKSISGKVPTPGGFVHVEINEQRVKVLSEVSGGTLFLDNKSYALKAGVETIVER